MDNVIERIAGFAYIDTRRALGFLPRRLVLPNLDLPCNSKTYFEFNPRGSRFIELRNARLYVGQDETAWQFGANDFMTSRSYSFRRADGRVILNALLKMEHSWHPDFNDDGSLKSWRSL